MPTDEIDELDRFGRNMDGFLMRALAGIQSTLVDMESRSLKPLFRLDVNDTSVTVVFDLPQVNKKDLAIHVTDDALDVEAKMTRPVNLKMGTGHSRGVVFERFSERVSLPVRVMPAKAKSKFANGILVVKIPRSRSRKAVRAS